MEMYVLTDIINCSVFFFWKVFFSSLPLWFSSHYLMAIFNVEFEVLFLYCVNICCRFFVCGYHEVLICSLL